jgi:P-type E1-E2 ATPase
MIRNGALEIKHMSKVLVGDIVKLEEGMEIPADGLVLESSELTTDESAMTGETGNLIKKSIKIQ